MIRLLLMGIAWVSVALGVVGIFIPVLPTTPLVLLAAFLFGKTSPRLNRWIQNTQVYKAYVRPFKCSGGITRRKKAHILGVSLGVLALSAVLVGKPAVWAILACVAAFLLWLMLVRIPTVSEDDIAHIVDFEVGNAVISEIGESVEQTAERARRSRHAKLPESE